jgi:hypothetical protein
VERAQRLSNTLEPDIKVSGYESAGGLTGDDLIKGVELVPLNATPKSLTVCSFNTNLIYGDKIAAIELRVVVQIHDFTLEEWCFNERVAVYISYGDQVSDK